MTIIKFIDPDEDDLLFDSDDWTFISDRGGLIHINDMTYMVFLTMELEIRKSLADITTITNFKDKATANILSKDLQQCWSNVSQDWKKETDSEVLLQLIVEQYITVRGFSAVGAFIEKYKQGHQRTVQKKKALRKSLN